MKEAGSAPINMKEQANPPKRRPATQKGSGSLSGHGKAPND